MVPGVGGATAELGRLLRADELGLIVLEVCLLLGVGHLAVGVGGALALVPELEGHLPHLLLLFLDGAQLLVPEGSRAHGADVAAEFRTGGRLGHRLAECQVVLTAGILPPHAHDPDHERHARRAEVLAHVDDELGQQVRVTDKAFTLLTLRLLGIVIAVDHVIEPLEPDEAGDLMTLLGIIGGADARGVCQHALHVLYHQTVILPRVRVGVRVLLDVTGRARVSACGWRTVIMIEGLAAPGRLDEQHRRVRGPVEREAEGVFGTDLATVLGRIPT